MITLSAADLLDVWEQGRDQSPLSRGLRLLAAAFPEESQSSLARLPIGQRDARLLQLRATCFGNQLESITRCPACGEQVELAFHTDDIWAGDEAGAAGPHTLTADEYEVTFRLPDSLDLQALSGGIVAEGGQPLLARCLIEVRHGDEVLAADDLPEAIGETVMARMEVLDPQADVTLALTCPACGHGWAVLFDIVSFFWAEVEAWARRTLHEVHILASVYGWREADVLALSAWRRQFYLEMVSG